MYVAMHMCGGYSHISTVFYPENNYSREHSQTTEILVLKIFRLYNSLGYTIACITKLF